MNQPFRFKQFSIRQQSAAMKIGTDAVLLGAWADISASSRILDIGTGTGILALQVAQRTAGTRLEPIIRRPVILGIEIEESAYIEAKYNMAMCPWFRRVSCMHISIQDFATKSMDKYDLIICNPPYFNNSYKAIDLKRNIARQMETMSFEELLKATKSLLSSMGKAAFIIPYEVEQLFIDIAREHQLFPYRITHVKGNMTSQIKRSLLMFSSDDSPPIIVEELVIEIERHVYTKQYIAIVKDFYLKM